MVEALPDPMDISMEDKRKSEVERILRYKPGDWHKILDVQPDCTPLVARKAALKSYLLIKDRFETGPEELKTRANEATKLIGDAADKLNAGNTYVEVNKDGSIAKPPSESEPYTPSSTVKGVYEQATASVLIIFSDAEDKSRAEIEIHQYNEDIRDIVLKENAEATTLEQISGFIDIKTIESYINLRRDHKKKASADSTKTLGLIGSMIDAFNARKGYPPTWNWDKQKYPEVWVATPAGTTTKETTFPPGQTEDGDTILGYLPFYKIDKEGVEYAERCEFVIEVDDEDNLGCMKIATWEEVGYEAGQAYIDQPDNQKLSIAHSMGRYARPSQRGKYAGLAGFWSEYSANKDRWGTTYCWINLKDGGYDIVNKGCFERIVGSPKKAMQEIYALFNNDETKYIWRDPSMGRANRMIREGPHGPVLVQKRMLIESGSSTNQQAATGKADNMQSSHSADRELAHILNKLHLSNEANTARIEQQNAGMKELLTAIQNLQQTRPG